MTVDSQALQPKRFFSDREADFLSEGFIHTAGGNCEAERGMAAAAGLVRGCFFAEEETDFASAY
jgi:hypothetical protein